MGAQPGIEGRGQQAIAGSEHPVVGVDQQRQARALPRRHGRVLPRTSDKQDAQASPVADFEASLDQLEQLVEKMEHGEMSLEESLAAYERGVGLYRKCQTALEQAELRVRLLSDPEQPDNAEPFGTPGADA